MRRALVLAGLLSLPLSACFNARGAAAPLVRVHAESDLDCPGEQIQVVEELGGRYMAVGCGRKVYYRTACDGLNCIVEADANRSIPWKDRPDPSR
jgi:hypothetical protein